MLKELHLWVAPAELLWRELLVKREEQATSNMTPARRILYVTLLAACNVDCELF